MDKRLQWPYAWTTDSRGELFTKDMHVLGGVVDAGDSYLYWANIADRLDVTVGHRKTKELAKQALIKFLAIV